MDTTSGDAADIINRSDKFLRGHYVVSSYSLERILLEPAAHSKSLDSRALSELAREAAEKLRNNRSEGAQRVARQLAVALLDAGLCNDITMFKSLASRARFAFWSHIISIAFLGWLAVTALLHDYPTAAALLLLGLSYSVLAMLYNARLSWKRRSQLSNAPVMFFKVNQAIGDLNARGHDADTTLRNFDRLQSEGFGIPSVVYTLVKITGFQHNELLRRLNNTP